jgi:tetratricopeptide (TPR) repeat protein
MADDGRIPHRMSMSIPVLLVAWAALAVRSGPDTLAYDTHWHRAIALVDQGRLIPDSVKSRARDSLYALAESNAARAVAENPLGADGHFALALAIGQASLSRPVEQRIKRAVEIRTEALAAIELDPRHDGAYHILGRWNAEIMRLSGFSRFVARRFLGAGVFKYASWDGATENLERAVQLDPGRIYHHLDLALVYLDRKRFVEARAELEKVAGQPERDPLDSAYKARAAALLARFEVAADTIERPALPKEQRAARAPATRSQRIAFAVLLPSATAS